MPKYHLLWKALAKRPELRRVARKGIAKPRHGSQKCFMRLRAHRSNDFPPRGTTRIDRPHNSSDHIPIRIFEAAVSAARFEKNLWGEETNDHTTSPARNSRRGGRACDVRLPIR